MFNVEVGASRSRGYIFLTFEPHDERGALPPADRRTRGRLTPREAGHEYTQTTTATGFHPPNERGARNFRSSQRRASDRGARAEGVITHSQA